MYEKPSIRPTVFDATYPAVNCISSTCYPLQDVLSTCIEGLLIYTVASGFKSYYSYTSILGECWPECHSDSHAIFDKDWSRTSPNRTWPPKLVGSSHRHQPGRASLVLPPRLDRSDYSEPWLWRCLASNEGMIPEQDCGTCLVQIIWSITL